MRRHWITRARIQAGWALLTNAHLSGFVTGRLYQGRLKTVCLPGLNCYSCPGSLGSCPIGALQAVLGKAGTRFSYYIVGFFLLVGGLLGRFVCGFLCPFGWVQELLNRIPFPVKIRTFRYDRALRFVKYGILIVFVIVLPMAVVNAAGGGSPWFCKWICPAGTLEAGIPLVMLTLTLRGIVGWLFGWKVVVLLAVVAGSIVMARPFCKYVCPLGAVYGLFNRVAVLRYRIDTEQCVHCGSCAKACPMAIDPVSECNHAECVRCGQCRRACPHNAIALSAKPLNPQSANPTQ